LMMNRARNTRKERTNLCVRDCCNLSMQEIGRAMISRIKDGG